MKQTTNYKLNQIELADSPPNIEVLNPNFDTIDEVMKSMSDKVDTAENDLKGKAPTDHASAETTHGIGISTKYGHVKLSDAVTSTSSNSSGVAATPKAVKIAYDKGVEAKTAADNAKTAADAAQSTADSALNSANASVKTVNGVSPTNGNVDVSVPVKSVDGKTGAIDLSGVYQPKGNYLTSAPVTSVNGKTGAVKINQFTSSASNPITSTSNDTTAKWVELGAGVYYFSVSGYLTDQPSQYGILVNFIAGNNVFQIWKCQPNGGMYTRGGNANGWSGTWKLTTDCLPFSGGTMTGSIGLVGGKAVYGTDTSSFVELKSGQNSTDGGRVTVIGKGNSNAGQVWLTAHDGTNSSALIAAPNGSLKWANKNVVRSINNTSADANGNVSITIPTNTSNWSISKGAKGWARDNSTGFTIQWTNVSVNQDGYATASWAKTFTTIYNAWATKAENDGYCRHIGCRSWSTTQVVIDHQGIKQTCYAIGIGVS